MDRFWKVSALLILTILQLMTGWWVAWLLMCSGFGLLRFGIKIRGIVSFLLIATISPLVWLICGFGISDYTKFAVGVLAIFAVMRSIAS